MAINDNILPNGFGATTGDDLVLDKPWYTGGTIRYVSSVSGDDTYSGLERLQPKATVGSANTASVAGDFIVLLADHDETLSADLAIAVNGLTIVGEGSSAGVPTASLKSSAAADNLIEVAATNFELRNVLIDSSTVSNSAARVQLGTETAADDALIKGCYFNCGANDQGSGLALGNGSRPRVESCTFISTATGTTFPEQGLEITSSGGVKPVIQDCIFDGGTVGFEGGVAVDLSAATNTFLRVESCSLLRGADALCTSASDGRIGFTTTTGGSRVLFS
jgi:hypothetical protein